jgi:hypothetical protein
MLFCEALLINLHMFCTFFVGCVVSAVLLSSKYGKKIGSYKAISPDKEIINLASLKLISAVKSDLKRHFQTDFLHNL